MLEEADSDVLILLDCCAAASSAGGSGKGITELIAACGFESSAPGVGEHSFTRTLIEELRYYGQRPGIITSVFLHNKVLARAMKSWNPRYASEGAQERRRTPIHINLADQSKRRCIELTPLPILPSSDFHQASSSTGSSSPSSLPSEDVDISDSDESNPSSLDEVWPDPAFNLPKVLISINLEEEQILRTEEWIEWLQSLPAIADSVSVEGVYRSNSTLLLITLPVAVWDLLPKDPAISFIAFVKSCNLMHAKDPTGQTREEAGNDQSEQERGIDVYRRTTETAYPTPYGSVGYTTEWEPNGAWRLMLSGGEASRNMRSTFHVPSGFGRMSSYIRSATTQHNNFAGATNHYFPRVRTILTPRIFRILKSVF